MQTKKLSCQRSVISLSALAGFGVIFLLVVGALGVYSFVAEPKSAAFPPAGAQSVAPSAKVQIEQDLVSIFNPPMRSIDSPDSTWVVTNKHRPLSPISYEPTNLRVPVLADPKTQNPSGQTLRDEVAWATERLAIAMRKAGAGTLVLNSGYRTFAKQQALYERLRNSRGIVASEKLIARAGFSEHQTGLAADFAAAGQGCVILVCFGQTEAGIWLSQNAHFFGFIIRYPEGKDAITGFQYEPWHFRYVGIALALEMKATGIETLEEFWGLPPSPEYY